MESVERRNRRAVSGHWVDVEMHVAYKEKDFRIQRDLSAFQLSGRFIAKM